MSETLIGLDKMIEQLKERETSEASKKLVFKQGFTFDEWPEIETKMRERYLGFIEQFYYENRKLPVKADFENTFPKSQLPTNPKDWENLLESLQAPLEARGLPLYPIDHPWLDPYFIAATSLIVNFHDRRSLNAKLKELNLTVKKWNGWMRIERYRAYFEARLNEIISEDTENQAKISLNQLIANGDLQAIKFFYEFKNIYRPQTDNLLLILQAIMEILAKYVQRDLLNTIAAELKTSPIIMGELEK